MFFCEHCDLVYQRGLVLMHTPQFVVGRGRQEARTVVVAERCQSFLQYKRAVSFEDVAPMYTEI